MPRKRTPDPGTGKIQIREAGTIGPQGAEDTMNDIGLRATVSGSFRQYMSAVQDAVYELTDRGVRVLSPADPRVVDRFGDFLFVASDRLRSIGLVEDRHLAAIEASDFLWLVIPHGYIGPSAAMEIGYATAVGTPVYSSEVPLDLGFRRYVRIVPGMREAILTLERPGDPKPLSLLVDPLAGLEEARKSLDAIEHGLVRSPRSDSESVIRRALADVRNLVGRR
jgi:hypothetical protein